MELEKKLVTLGRVLRVVGGLGVVLGRWDGGGPRFGGVGGLSLVGFLRATSHMSQEP